LRSVRVHLRVLAHQLVVVGADGNPRKFTFMNRDEAEAAIEALGPRLGDRLEVTPTPTYAFLRRRAPFLLR